jgi:hypothetical protein
MGNNHKGRTEAKHGDPGTRVKENGTIGPLPQCRS